jgi:hypothetical protein
LTTVSKWGVVRIIGLVALTAMVIAFGVVPAFQEAEQPPPPDPVDQMDAYIAQTECRLATITTEVPDGVHVVRCELPDPAAKAGFYCRNQRTRQAFLYQKHHDSHLGTASLYLYRDKFVVASATGEPLQLRERDGWELFTVVPPGAEPAMTETPIHEFEMADGFMRTDFARNDGWKISSGRWGLNQYGGGLADSEWEAESASFQRAVNPFSIVGIGRDGTPAVLEFDRPTARGHGWLTEARFYLGEPHRGATAIEDNSTEVPAFLISQGEVNGVAVGFGWWSISPDAKPAWRLVVRKRHPVTGDLLDWEVAGEWHGRPPLSNWTRVGLGIAHGHMATPILDGEELDTVALPIMVNGNFHIRTANDGTPIELDDVAAGPWPAVEADLGTRVVIQSTTFSDKREKSGRDPEQFAQWAKGEKAFALSWRGNPSVNVAGPHAIVRYPFFGDFTYRSEPSAELGGYRFIVAKSPAPQSAEDVLVDFNAERGDGGWRIGNSPHVMYTLEFGRRGNRFFAGAGAQQQSFEQADSGAVYMIIVPPVRQMLAPDRHQVYSKTLYNYMFEQAPTDWSWQDGHFGMNVRWACQPGWNFMAGKAENLAALHSKAAFNGDQVIDAFMSLAFTMSSYEQYYIRRDLCVSFCTDGRNLDSGYTLVFGGENNTKTVLMKRGKVLAATNNPRFLFPRGWDHQQVHWRWWNFEIYKAESRLTVLLNGDLMFDLDDPQPIEGGHVAFWTVGNGFVVSRLTIAADGKTMNSGNSRFDWSGNSDDLLWKPVQLEGVRTTAVDGGVTVHNPAAGGTFAARTTSAVNLTQTPTLRLPMKLESDVHVNLHVEVDSRPYVLQLNAPVDEMYRLLTPASERAVGFTRSFVRGSALERSVLGRAEVKDDVLEVNLGELLENKGVTLSDRSSKVVLTVGNSSNKDYLLAGFSGNHAGSEYWLGKPEWK